MAAADGGALGAEDAKLGEGVSAAARTKWLVPGAFADAPSACQADMTKHIVEPEEACLKSHGPPDGARKQYMACMDKVIDDACKIEGWSRCETTDEEAALTA